MRAAGTRAELFVTGRLCLFGEHSDWAAGYRRSHPELSSGYCLVVGTDQGLAAEVEARSDALELKTVLSDGDVLGPEEISISTENFDQVARRGGFFSYAAGVAAEIAARDSARGLALDIRADLPIRKGLSSSAAICVLVARAYNQTYNLGLSIRDEMEIAYAGERRAGSECGRMDQICAFGRQPTFLRFDGDEMAIEPLDPGGDFHLLIVDLRRGKDTRKILARLNACFPDAPGPIAATVREALGPCNAALLEHARQAVRGGDARALGELMIEAQTLFDQSVAPACDELRAPRLHEVLSHPAVRDLAWGGKGVGSQGDGSAQLVACGPEEREELSRRLTHELEVQCLPLTIRTGRD